jgi:hypothetical protein
LRARLDNLHSGVEPLAVAAHLLCLRQPVRLPLAVLRLEVRVAQAQVVALPPLLLPRR